MTRSKQIRLAQRIRQDLLACLGLVFCLFHPLPLYAQSSEAEFVEGLRARGLLELAVAHCQAQLEQQLSPGEQAEWTVQWMRSVAAQAQQAGKAERADFWQAAADISDDFQARNPAHPRGLLVSFHAALIQLARGQLERLEAEITGDRQEATESARQQLRLAIRQLQQMDQQLPALLRQAPRESSGAEFSRAELVSLEHNLHYQRGRAYRQQALSYPAASDDALAALGRATEQLEKPLTQLAEEDPLTARVLLELAAVTRLRNQATEADVLLKRLEQLPLAPELVLATRAERVQLSLASGMTARAIELLQQPRRLEGKISAQLDLALLDTYLALARDADQQMDMARLKELEKQALQLVSRIRQEHGGYWGRRAEIRLVRQAGQLPGSSNLGIMEKTADDLYLRGKLTEAITAYQQAGQQAMEAEELERAFGLFFKAALVSERQQDIRGMVDQLRKMSQRLHEHPRSPLVHLKAIQHAYQLAEKDESWQPIYQQMLTTHLQNWPTDSSADQVRIWIAAQARVEKNWAAAIASYRTVSRDYVRMPAVLEVLETCWLNHLVQLEQEERTDQLAVATADFHSHFQDSSGRYVEQWSPAARQAVLAISRIQLQLQAASFVELEGRIRSASGGQPPPEPSWSNDASAILMVALAGQGKLAQADQLIQQVAAQSAPRLFQVMASLAEMAEQETTGNRQLSQLQLALFERSAPQRARLNAAQQVSWDLAHGKALAAAGKQGQAEQLLKSLAAARKESAQVQQTLAEVLMAGPQRESWQSAQLQWRRVLARARPQGQLWYEAKYGIALCYFKLGEKQEAAARIEYLQATSGLPVGSLKQQFLDLLAKCK